MSGWRALEGKVSAQGRRFAIVAARFHDSIVNSLIEGAMEALKQHGAAEPDIRLIRVPGAFELPYAAQAAALQGDIDAVIALGCVVRGGTPHFEYVSGACVEGLSRVALTLGIPVALGVLTTESIEQAAERAQPGTSNKGFEAAVAAIEMADLAGQLRKS